MKKVLALAAVLVMSACGSSSSSSGTASPSGPSKVASLAAELPAGTKVLQVGVDSTYAPNEFIDPNSGAIVGWDVDLGNAVAKVLGISLVWNNADFSSIIPDIGTRYDIGISSFTPTTDREKTVDFVTYYQAGESWFVKSGGPQISGPADMCGKTVTVQTGTTEESDAWGYLGKKPDGSTISGDADNCKTAGKSDFTVHSFTKQTDSNADLLAGHAEIAWADQPVADYQVKLSSGQLAISGKPCSISPYGFAMGKGSPLEKPFQDAIKYLIDNGYYTTILTNWNVQDGAVTDAGVGLNVNSIPNQPSCVPSY